MHSLNLMLAKEDRTALLLRLFNDTTPLINNANPAQRAREREAKEKEETSAKEVAPGFKVEDGEIKVDVVGGEGTAPVNGAATDSESVIKPGPYGVIVADADNAIPDVKAQAIEMDQDPKGDVEGQLGDVS